MSAELNIIKKAVMHAAKAMDQVVQRSVLLPVDKKLENDFIPKVEQAILHELFFHLHKAFPEDEVETAEQSLNQPQDSQRRWLLIPLDGAVNLLYGIPHCAMAVSLLEQGVVKQTAVYNPFTDDLFYAKKGGGALLNQQRIRIARHRQIDDAVIASNTPEDSKQLSLHLLALRNISKKVADCRSLGCSILDLAYVAAARLDVYWQTAINVHKIIATELLIEEAGGQCLDFNAERKHKIKGQIIAGNLENSAWLAGQLKEICKKP